ncbi:MAG: C_GCAxxG_C_C family protein [Deltaproteobacteria bacterium]|nr:C_GCAxxG_C_C family protein [Deltaproteobacteria bacterium]
MNRMEKAEELSKQGLNCSQAILTVYGSSYGIDPEKAKQLGRPFGGGMGRLALTCGALTGAVMVLGLAKDHPVEAEARELSYGKVRELFQRFEARHGTTLCKELLGADLSTEEGRQKAREDQLVSKVCPGLVREVCELLDLLL